MAKLSKSRSKKSREREKQSAARHRKAPRQVALPILVCLAAWLSAFLLLLGVKPFYSSNFLIGQSAPATVVALTDFEAIDLARTELGRQQAAGRTLPVFTVDFAPYDRAVRRLGTIFDLCGSLRGLVETNGMTMGEVSRSLEELLQDEDIDLELDEIMNLCPAGPDAEDMLETIKSELKTVVGSGIASAKEKSEQFQGVASSGSIDIENGDGSLFSVAVEDLMTPASAADKVVANVAAAYTGEVSTVWLKQLVEPLIRPNLKFNPKLTESNRAAARAAAPVRNLNVRKGEIIVSIGEEVTPQVNENLMAHQDRLNETTTLPSKILKRVGQGCLLLTALIACIGMFALMRPRAEASSSALTLMLSLSILVLLAVRGLIYASAATRMLPPALIDSIFPLALAAMMAGLLINAASALVLGVWVSFAAAVMFDNSFLVLLEGLAVSTVAALGVRHARKRHQVYRAGIAVGLVMMLIHLAMGIYHDQMFKAVATHSLLALANGMVCASLTVFLVPLMEYLFGRTTDIRLLELSDLSHPLLRRMALEAPGTYHHSLMMASLAQAAADEIGANSLLVRVSAYFHDIGKLSKPEFFAENIKGDRNPHDDLAPSMSMLVIAAHVKEGVTLAKRHKLPDPIIDAIQQHHAAGTVKYFYHRAMREAEMEKNEGVVGGSRFDGEHYRYDCPRPHSKEMAILSMADSVEAASRTVEKPTPGRIEALVDDVIDSKLKDHQLDEAALTLAEISAIKRSFVFTILNMRHGRVEYPKENEINEDRAGEPAKPAEDKPGRAQETGGAADGADRPA
jgi:cyclic-di-AMP phosphodiesterase PgpH